VPSWIEPDKALNISKLEEINAGGLDIHLSGGSCQNGIGAG
jgi:hypothetical protein